MAYLRYRCTVMTAHDVETVLVDGYVDLGERPGLGRYLLDALHEDGLTPSMVGVAKTEKGAQDAAISDRRAAANPVVPLCSRRVPRGAPPS